jgi:hypothetical protein
MFAPLPARDGPADPPGPNAPVAPSIARPSFVPWLGDHQGSLLDSLDRSIAGAVAASLPHAARNASALARARRDLGLGVMFDLEAWRIQLPLDHPKRGVAWRGLGLDPGRIYKPDAQLISEAAALRQAGRALNAQTDHADPTIFTTPAHWLEGCQAGRGRENELKLMRACVERFYERALSEPVPDDPHARRRGLFGALIVEAGKLEPADVGWLIEAHADVAVAGYFVWVVNFQKRLGQARLVDELLLGLQAKSARPVVAGGLSHWHTAELARGLAATCTGPHRAEYRLPPFEPPKVGDDEEPPGRAVHLYFAPALGCFGLRSEDEPRRRQGFLRSGCPCGHHQPHEPPRTHEEIVAHNAYWLWCEAAEALRGSTSQATARLASRVPAARAVRNKLGMGRLPACWSALAEPGQRRKSG